MSVTARQLSKSGARGKEIGAVVREQVQILDDKLLRAPRSWGRNVVTHELPANFGFPGLEKKDAQRIIYSAILRSLEDRGFETALVLEADASTLYVAWLTDLDVGEVEAMNAHIRARRLARDKVADFVSSGRAHAPRAASAARQGRAEPAPPLKVKSADRVMRPRGGMATEGAPELRLAEPDAGGASDAELALLNAAPG